MFFTRSQIYFLFDVLTIHKLTNLSVRVWSLVNAHKTYSLSAASASRSTSWTPANGAGRQNSSCLVRRKRNGSADVLLRPERTLVELLIRREWRRAADVLFRCGSSSTTERPAWQDRRVGTAASLSVDPLLWDKVSGSTCKDKELARP